MVSVEEIKRLVFPLKELPVMHEYSDEGSLPAATLHVYALEEILSEKLRAFSGQRKHAIARDVYDIYQISKSMADVKKAIGAFPEKCRVKGIIPAEIDFDKVIKRQAEYEANWRTNLEYLIPATMKVTFVDAWNTSLELLKRAMGK
ncbi:nucleotidyl transferase AbiEii/AbiGii toxin family protein [candidate division KSB1 bacterium]|nr:nucleotidyl transferase AbiEii/AbiGii toxin family protein [candidate division KSB1 bacterium]